MPVENEMPSFPNFGLEIMIKEKEKILSTCVNGFYFSPLGPLPAAIKSK